MIRAAALLGSVLLWGCAKGPPQRAPGRVGCVTFVAPAGWTATPSDTKVVHGWILTSPDRTTEFRIWGSRAASQSPREAMDAIITLWEDQARSGDGGTPSASPPLLDDFQLDGAPALKMQSTRGLPSASQHTRRNVLTVLHEGIAYTAAAMYDAPRAGPDPLAPVASGFLHSVRVKCESTFPFAKPASPQLPP